jgi:ATP/maltotriose-dependent transcriptional regulator MalT
MGGSRCFQQRHSSSSKNYLPETLWFKIVALGERHLMICARCEKEAPEGSRYCPNCGLLLQARPLVVGAKKTRKQTEQERQRWAIEHERQHLFAAAFRTATQRHKILTNQQWWVARFISHGHNNESIGHQLEISLSRVKKIVGEIKGKTGKTQRTEIARWFIGL